MIRASQFRQFSYSGEPIAGRERECLDLITGRLRATGVPPSVREIVEDLHLASTSSAHRLLARLESRGDICRLPYRARALALTGPLPDPPLVHPGPQAEYFVVEKDGDEPRLVPLAKRESG